MAGSDTTLVRARDSMGRFIADDPATPDVNEAWVVDNDTNQPTGGGE